MSRAAKDVLAEAMALSEDERLQVASELIASVDGPSEAGWDDAWFEEVRARDARHPDPLPASQRWTEVRHRLLAKISR